MQNQSIPFVQPCRPTEETLRCEAYRLMVNAGLQVVAQYPVPLIPEREPVTFREMRSAQRNKGFVDLAIVSRGQIVGFIETKKNAWTMDEWAATRQGQSYLAVGPPVFLLCSMDQMASMVDWATALASA